MTVTKDVTIFIAEDHPISLMGLKMMLEETAHFKIIGEAEDGKTAVEKVLLEKPDVVMMDLGLPEIDGIEATARIKEQLPSTRILIFTAADDDDSIFDALKAGADGYCLKSISRDSLATAIHSVMDGAAWLDPTIANKVLRAQTARRSEEAEKPKTPDLTDSKLRLLALIEQGLSFDEISEELGINDSLAKGLLNELMQQLQGASGAAKSSSPFGAKRQTGRSLTDGDVIAQHYKIEKQLGFGGMGMVFKARHTFIDRIVAIKTMHEHLAYDDRTRARFMNEAQATVSISHPNLVSIFDCGLHDNRIPYMVMEFLDGSGLDDLLERLGRITVPRASNIFV
ncbi:MAG: response regulator, partial [Cyanobacteria bacterium]|nr:response regulator [Cyanobacteriota bacterium]